MATFGGQRHFQIGTKKRSLVIVEIVGMHQIFPSKNSNLATIFDFSLKLLSSSSVFFIVDRIMNGIF